MTEGHRSNHQIPLEERIAAFADSTREVARLLPPGAEKDELFQKARQADKVAQGYKLVDVPSLWPSER